MNIDAQITFLYTDDLERSARFYEEVLGLELALDQGGCRIYRAIGGAFIGICHKGDMRAAEADIILTLVTDDVDGWHERIAGQGWQVEHPPRRNETYGIHHFFMRDPNGYRIEIQRFDSADWDQAEASR